MRNNWHGWMRGAGIAGSTKLNTLATGFYPMEMNESSPENASAPVVKKPYEKPSFRYEKVFVTTALSCGKIGDTSLDCHNRPSAS